MPTQSEISLSPISAKGDILTTDGSSRTRLSVGTNGQILTARSSASSGIQFETVVGGSSTFVLISSTTVTAGVDSVTISFSGDTSVAAYYVTGSWRCTRTSESESGIYPNNYTTNAWNYYNIYHYGTVSPLTMSSARGQASSPGSLPIVYPAYSDSTYYDANAYTTFEYYVTNGVAAATGYSPRTAMLGIQGGAYNGTTTGTIYGRAIAMICSSQATQPALTSIVMNDGNPSFSDIAIGSIFRVYAIKKA
jgi:hypothetical protein